MTVNDMFVTTTNNCNVAVTLSRHEIYQPRQFPQRTNHLQMSIDCVHTPSSGPESDFTIYKTHLRTNPKHGGAVEQLPLRRMVDGCGT